MSNTHSVPPHTAQDAVTGHHDTAGQTASTGFWHGRSGLIVPGILAAFSTYLMVGLAVMEVPEGTDQPGPEFFPLVIAIAGYIVAALLVVSYIRNPEPAEPATFSEHDDVSDEEREEAWRAAQVPYKTFTDWSSVAWAAGGFLAFAILLPYAGWIIAAALLFWCVARAMNSQRPIQDIVVGLIVSSVVYLAFSVLLDLNLPSGILGGGF